MSLVLALLVLCSPSLRPVTMEMLSLPFCYWVRCIRDCSGCFSASWSLSIFPLTQAKTLEKNHRNTYHYKSKRFLL